MRTAPKQDVSRTERLGAFVHSRLDDARLPPSAFRVYCCLLRLANTSDLCWPSHSYLAAQCLVCEGTVKKALQYLRKNQFITITPRANAEGGQTSNLIRVLGIPVLEPTPQAIDTWGVGHGVTGGESPDDYEDNPIEDNPIDVCDRKRSVTSQKQQIVQILKSDELPDFVCELKDSFTETTLQAAWIPTRRYFLTFSFVQSKDNVSKCLQAFAAAIQVSPSFQQQAIDFLAGYQVPPDVKEQQIRDGLLLPLSTPYWDVIKHLHSRSKAIHKTSKSNRDFEEETARHAAAQANPVTGNLFSQLRKEKRT